MKLNYRILWIDDRVNESPFVRMREQLREYLSNEEFFDVFIDCVEDIEDFNIDANSLDYDLIITDYNLSDKKDGDQIINEIRSHSILTEIFFYSANELPTLSNLSRVTFFQLEPSSLYKGLYDEIKKTITLTLKLFHNIISMRGMIMHETSFLDAQSEEILKSYIICDEAGCKNCEEKEKCTPIAEAVFKKLTDHLNEKIKKVNKKDLKKIMNDNFLFSADYKILTLNKILEALEIPDFSGEYKKEIINVRNQFAHAVLMKDEQTGREYFKNKSEGITFDEDFCRNIRKNINKHKGNLDNLQRNIR